MGMGTQGSASLLHDTRSYTSGTVRAHHQRSHHAQPVSGPTGLENPRTRPRMAGARPLARRALTAAATASSTLGLDRQCWVGTRLPPTRAYSSGAVLNGGTPGSPWAPGNGGPPHRTRTCQPLSGIWNQRVAND